MALAAAGLFAAGCSSSHDGGAESSTNPTTATATAHPDPVGRFASDNPGSVNMYWIHAPQGLVLVDTLRTVTDARHAIEQVRGTGRPVVAILLTHSHPDHVGGAGEFHNAFPQAPIYASVATAKAIREDPRGFYPLTRTVPNSDFPEQMTHPDRTFQPGDNLDIGGLRLETAEFADGESDTATVYHDPASNALYGGDLVGNHVTPALLEGHSCGWLVNLDKLLKRFPTARTFHPGHGAPGDSHALIDAQRGYLQRFRALVRAAVAPASPGGTAIEIGEQQSIIATMDREYPDHPRVASLPTLTEENIKGVAAEFKAQDQPTPPPTCQAP